MFTLPHLTPPDPELLHLPQTTPANHPIPLHPQDEKCRFSKASIGSTCSGYIDIESKSEDQLQVASATVGPISVGIDASHIGFQVM